MYTKIGTFKGYAINYDDHQRNFTATDSENKAIAMAPTQGELEETLKKMAKKSFSPIKALKNEHNDVREIEVTSFNPDDKTIWIAYRDNKPGHYGSSRTKENLRYDRGIYQDTPTNRELKVKIEGLVAQMDAIQKEIDETENQFESPINADYFGLKEPRY